MNNQALSFGHVADQYDRSRPSYPEEAARWLTGPGSLTVLELGAGTGKLTETLVAHGHRVVATDPLAQMLLRLQSRTSPAATVVATAEGIPLPSRSVDVAVCAQSFHWFDHERALPEIARVLRPGGTLALVWNMRDEAVPWVRRLSAIIGSEGTDRDNVKALRESPLFGWVDETQFRSWQQLNRASLLDLVASRSYVAALDESDREEVLERVGSLYDEYGRGHDGMLLPYLTNCYRAVVQHPPEPPPEPTPPPDAAGAPEPPPEDPGTLLIDFR